MNAALLSYFPSSDLRDTPGRAYADGAPAVTRRMTALVQNLSRGDVDRSQFAVLASINIPAAAAQIKTYGSLQHLRFFYKIYTSSGKLYAYEAVFAKQTAMLEVLLGKDGKFASFELIPV